MLEAHGLSHRVGTKQLFADLTLLGEAGQLLVVTGPSGAGKSTLLRLLGGLDRLGGSGSGSGSVAVGGTDIGSLRGGGLRRHLRNTVGYAFQDAGLVEHWTVARNLRAAARARSATPAMPPSTVVQAARRLDVAPLLPAHAHTLSGGERQRVALAALLTRMTPVMLVDEPTAALDRSLAHRVIGVLQELARGGALVIAASHDADLVDVADTVIRLG